MKVLSTNVVQLLTVTELCNYLKVKRRTIYRLLKAGKLPAFRVGRDWRFNLEEIDLWRELEKKPDTRASEFPPVIPHPARANA
jgi:excisionase family DNA binding protein